MLAQKEVWFLVAGSNGWGVGPTLAKAKTQWRKHAFSPTAQPTLMRRIEQPMGCEKPWVDDAGWVHVDESASVTPA